MKTISKKASLTLEQKQNLAKDFNSEKFTSNVLMSKYNIKSLNAFRYILKTLRKNGLIKTTNASIAMKKAWITRRAAQNAQIKNNVSLKKSTDSDSPVSQYRTIYFKDFSVRIHKKSMTRLVVDHKNDLHILTA